jgi:hypothetical protein
LDDLTYEVISWLAGGHTVFRPREATRESEESFRPVVALLAQLRERGWVHYLEGHVSQTAGGIYLMVGPVQLTEPGKAALERDRRLGLDRRAREIRFRGASKTAPSCVAEANVPP